MRRFFAGMIALVLMLQATALASTIIFTRNDYEESSAYSWNYAIGQYDDDMYVFFQLSEQGVRTTGYSVVEDLTQPIEPLEYEVKSEAFYNYFPSGDQIGAFYYAEDGRFHLCHVTFDEDRVISHEEIGTYGFEDEGLEYYYPTMPTICGDYFISASISESGVYSLYALDMQAERMRVIDTDDAHALLNVVGICPYDAESVVVAAQDADLGPVVTFYLYTPGENKLAQVAVISADKADIVFSTPAYDSETDTLYYIADDALCAMTGFDTDTIVVLPDYDDECFCMQNAQAFLSTDGYYVVSDGTTICAASTNPDAVNEVVKSDLTIYSNGEDDVIYDTIHALGRNDGDVEIQYITERPEGSDISTDIIAQSGAIDLYMLDTNSAEYAALLNRGYLRPIESEKIQHFVDRMYPQMRDIMTQDGQALAIPVNFNASSLAYNPEVFASLGLTEDDVPETWMEFITLLQRMPELVVDTDYAVFGAWNVDSAMQSLLANAIIQDFCQRYVAGEEMDTAQLSALLTELSKIDFYNMGLSTDRDNRLDDENARTVFCQSFAVSLRRDDGFYQPMPLGLQEGTQGVFDGELTVLILNPYSENQEAAIAFLEAMLDYVPATVQASICADWEGGVKMDGADENLQSVEDEIAMIQAELDAATDEDEIEQYQTMMDDAIAQKEWLMARFYWEVSPELLEAYQARAGRIRIDQYIGLDYWEVIVPIIEKYLAGGSTADVMIEEMVNKLNLAMNE